MLNSPQEVKHLVEVITREVLIALEEEQYAKKTEHQHGEYCTEECAEGICVKTCFNRAGEVVDAGASRLTSQLGSIPDDPDLAGMIDHTLLKPDATADQIAQLCYEARKYNLPPCASTPPMSSCAPNCSRAPQPRSAR